MRDAHLADAGRLEHQRSQRGFEVGTERCFDQLADQEIADVGIGPADTRRVGKRVGLNLIEQFRYHPGRIASLNGGEIFRQFRVIPQTCFVTQQLPQRERAARDRFVEPELAALNQDERRGRHAGLGDAPPRHRSRSQIAGKLPIADTHDDQRAILKRGEFGHAR